MSTLKLSGKQNYLREHSDIIKVYNVISTQLLSVIFELLSVIFKPFPQPRQYLNAL
jgi:hypothetical protein